MSEELNNRLQSIFNKKRESGEVAKKAEQLEKQRDDENKDIVSKFITEKLNPIFIEVRDQLVKNGCAVEFQNNPYLQVTGSPKRIIGITMRVSPDGKRITLNGPRVEISYLSYSTRTINLSHHISDGGVAYKVEKYNIDSIDIDQIEKDIYSCVERIISK